MNQVRVLVYVSRSVNLPNMSENQMIGGHHRSSLRGIGKNLRSHGSSTAIWLWAFSIQLMLGKSAVSPVSGSSSSTPKAASIRARLDGSRRAAGSKPGYENSKIFRM